MQPDLKEISQIGELPKNNDQLAFSIFVSKKGRRMRHDLHCIACGLTFNTVTYSIVSMVDNPGPPNSDYIETMCKRCKQLYRIYII